MGRYCFLFYDGFDAADASGAGLFLLDLEMTNYASMFDVRATTNLARNWIVEVTNCVDGEFFWIFIPELTVSLEYIARVGFVVLVMDNLEVGLNPFVDLVFDLLLFFWSQFAI